MTERSILNQIILGREHHIMSKIKDYWFQDERNKEIFKIISSLDEINKEAILYFIDGNFEGIKRSNLINYLNHICGELDFSHYTVEDLKYEYEKILIQKKVRELAGLDIISQKNKIIKLSEELQKDVNDNSLKTIDLMHDIVMKNIDSKQDLLLTPWKGLNDYIGGLEGYVIIGGRPSMGKTDVANNIVINFIHNRKRGIYFTFEDTAERLYKKFLSYETEIDRMKIYKGILQDYEKEKLHRCDKFNHQYLFIYDKSMNIYEIKDRILYAYNKYNISWFVIDYIELIDMDFRSDLRSEINKISGIIKNIVTNYGLLALILSQVNERQEKAEITHHLGNLKESGKLEADADMVIYTEGKREEKERKLHIAKNRLGAVGRKIRLSYYPEYGILKDVI